MSGDRGRRALRGKEAVVRAFCVRIFSHLSIECMGRIRGMDHGRFGIYHVSHFPPGDHRGTVYAFDCSNGTALNPQRQREGPNRPVDEANNESLPLRYRYLVKQGESVVVGGWRKTRVRKGRRKGIA